MTPNITPPKLVIPTGYEGDQRSIDRKRELAEAMLARGLNGPGANATSYAQLAGTIAQALAGKILEKRADKLSANLNSRISEDYANQRKSFYDNLAASGGQVDPQAIIRDYGGKPFLSADVAPYQEALAERLKGDQKIVDNNGYWQRSGDVLGTQAPNDPNKDVWRLPDGSVVPNAAKTYANLAAAGQLPTSPPPVIADPLAPKTAAPMANLPPQQPIMKQGPDGQSYMQINGKWYKR